MWNMLANSEGQAHHTYSCSSSHWTASQAAQLTLPTSTSMLSNPSIYLILNHQSSRDSKTLFLPARGA